MNSQNLDGHYVTINRLSLIGVAGTVMEVTIVKKVLVDKIVDTEVVMVILGTLEALVILGTLEALVLLMMVNFVWIMKFYFDH